MTSNISASRQKTSNEPKPEQTKSTPAANQPAVERAKESAEAAPAKL